MPHTISLTPAAVEDIQAAMDYYNSRSENLGFRFTDEVDNALQSIAKYPLLMVTGTKMYGQSFYTSFLFLSFLP